MRYTTRIIVPPRIRRSGQPGTGGAYRPQVLGVRRSFGFDDPFGLASVGHLGAVALHPEIAPVLVQHEARGEPGEGNSPSEAMANVVRAVGQARYRLPWGADADRLRASGEVEAAAAAGFTYYTLDPGDYLRHDVDTLSPDRIDAELNAMLADGVLSEDWHQPYLHRTIDLPGERSLTLELDPLRRAAVKYARAIQHCARLAESVVRANQGRPYETEACLGAATGQVSALEHLFIGLELEARGVRLTSLALPLVNADDARDVRSGDEGATASRLREHAAVAEFCGPYKLSFHHVSLLPSLLPLLGACCGDALHVKTRHLSFLEALRVVYRTDPALFSQITRAATLPSEASGETAEDKLVRAVTSDPDEDWSDAVETGQMLDGLAATLTCGTNPEGEPWKTAIVETLVGQADVYREQLTTLFDKRLELLKAG